MHRRSTADTDVERLGLVPIRPRHRWLRGVLVLIAMIVLADALVGEQSLSSSLRARKEYDALERSSRKLPKIQRRYASGAGAGWESYS